MGITGTDQRGSRIQAQDRKLAITHEDRCIGSLLGTACGDILGAAVEGMAARKSAASTARSGTSSSPAGVSAAIPTIHR